MRRFVAVLLVALLAFTLVGCGGGGGAEEQAATPPPAAPPPAPTTPEEEALIPDRSAEETAVFEPFPTGDFVPDSLAKKVAEKQPTIILFVDGSQKDTNDEQTEVNAVLKENEGLIDLFSYDIGKYVSLNKNGTITVDQAGLQENQTAADAVSLARELGIKFTPYVVITDNQGYIIFKHSGYIDRELLDAQVQRVTD